MDLYLVRHGEAKLEEEDPARPLSERGRGEVERVGRALARLGLGVSEIRHSGKLRARETAEILGRHLRPGRGLGQTPGLAPNDDPAAARATAEEATESLMLVGHLPHLSGLASLLLTGDPSREVVAFRMASVVALRLGPEGWRLGWALTPEMVSE